MESCLLLFIFPFSASSRDWQVQRDESRFEISLFKIGGFSYLETHEKVEDGRGFPSFFLLILASLPEEEERKCKKKLSLLRGNVWNIPLQSFAVSYFWCQV